MQLLKGKPKEKRKGRRGNYTFILTCLAVFVFVWFLIRAPIVEKPPTPTPVPPSATPAAIPPRGTASVSPIAVPPLKPLQLRALCSPNPRIQSSWQVLNPNPYPVTFSWIVQSAATSQAGQRTVTAMGGGALGTLSFNAFSENPGVLMRIFVNDQLQAMSLSNNQPCQPATSTSLSH
jgi:hypothetical protein